MFIPLSLSSLCGRRVLPELLAGGGNLWHLLWCAQCFLVGHLEPLDSRAGFGFGTEENGKEMGF